MNEERLMKILLAPHISEKTTALADKNNRVAFRVLPDATKAEIKQAIEFLFNVKVESVNVLNVEGKRKRVGAIRGKHSNWKKAYVRLAAGQQIDFFGAPE